MTNNGTEKTRCQRRGSVPRATLSLQHHHLDHFASHYVYTRLASQKYNMHYAHAIAMARGIHLGSFNVKGSIWKRAGSPIAIDIRKLAFGVFEC